MNGLFSLLIILVISLVGEVLSYLIPLPIPACIYGMALMFAGLVTGIIPLNKVKRTGKFLIDIMPVMFIPAAVGLLDTWPVLQGMLLPFVIAIIPVTLVVMGISGLVTQIVLKLKKRRSVCEADPS